MAKKIRKYIDLIGKGASKIKSKFVIPEEEKQRLIKSLEAELSRRRELDKIKNLPTTRESLTKMAEGKDMGLQDSMNVMKDYPEFTPQKLKKKKLTIEEWVNTADESELMKRYEELSERSALQRALSKKDPSKLNPPQLKLYNELQLIINKIGGTTSPSTLTPPSPPTSGGPPVSSPPVSSPPVSGPPSIVQQNIKSTVPITSRQKTNAQTSLAINMRKSGLYTPQEQSELKGKFMLALENKTPVKLRHLPPTDPNSSKIGIYSGFGDPFDINNWEIQ